MCQYHNHVERQRRGRCENRNFLPIDVDSAAGRPPGSGRPGDDPSGRLGRPGGVRRPDLPRTGHGRRAQSHCPRHGPRAGQRTDFHASGHAFSSVSVSTRRYGNQASGSGVLSGNFIKVRIVEPGRRDQVTHIPILTQRPMDRLTQTLIRRQRARYAISRQQHHAPPKTGSGRRSGRAATARPTRFRMRIFHPQRTPEQGLSAA